MTLDEYAMCLDMATARMASGYTVNVHLNSGRVLTDVTPERANRSMAVVRVVGPGGGPTADPPGQDDSYYWVSLSAIAALEVVGTLAADQQLTF